MSIWDKVKGSLFEAETPQPGGAAALPVPAPIPGAMPSQVPVATSFAPVATVPQQAKPEMVNQVESTFLSSAPAEYTAFLGHYNSLADTITDKPTLFKAAIKLCSKQGVTVERILFSLEQAGKILADQVNLFNVDYQAQLDATVGGKVAQANKTEAEIAELEKQIAALRAQVETLRVSIADESNHLESVRTDFMTAHQFVTHNFNQLKAALAMYGKA